MSCLLNYGSFYYRSPISGSLQKNHTLVFISVEFTDIQFKFVGFFLLGFDLSMAGTGPENRFRINIGRYIYGYGIVFDKFKYVYVIGKSYFWVTRYGRNMGK